MRAKYNIFLRIRSNSLVNIEIIYVLVEFICGVVFSLYWINRDTKTAYIGSTICYQITPKGIIFEWGYRNKKIVTIPFSDITSINLVEFPDTGLDTIYFYTNSDYKLFNINFDNGQDRHTYTFEKVENGRYVYELLSSHWQKCKHLKSLKEKVLNPLDSQLLKNF